METHDSMIRAQVDGLLAWWSLAGVDTAIDEGAPGWMAPPPAAQAKTAPKAQPVAAFPDNLSAFHEFLETAPKLPENIWTGRRVLPQGQHAPRVMLIVDMPDTLAQAAQTLFDPAATRLIERMMAAIGVAMQDCYLASLSVLPAPGGLFEDHIRDELVRRMRHHIALVAPRSIIALGDQASRALISTEDVNESKNLPFVNHRDGTISAVPLVHPRLMLGQPSAKSEAWRQLRLLAKGWGQ
ncbi:MAG: uracil-DNA glycosylase family protein [Sphingobium sp.]